MHYMMWLLLSCLMFAVGEYLSQCFANEPKISTVIYLVIIDIFAIVTWLPAIMQKNHLVVVGTIWSILSLVCTVLIGTLIFNEQLNTRIVVGLIFSFVAIILLV